MCLTSCRMDPRLREDKGACPKSCVVEAVLGPTLVFNHYTWSYPSWDFRSWGPEVLYKMFKTLYFKFNSKIT